MTLKAAVAASVLAALTVVLTGCTGTVAATSAPSLEPAGAEALLDEHGLDGKDAVSIVDHLDRLGGDERPRDLTASVRPGELLLASDDGEFVLPLPEDRFYLSVAPYLDATHDCFHHSLTTCTGELGSAEVQVVVVDETHDEVLVDETRTTFENGFTGFWLPRGIEGSVRVAYGDTVGEVNFATTDDDPTCVTSLQLR